MHRHADRFFATSAVVGGASTGLALSVQSNEGATLLMAFVRAAVIAGAALAGFWLLRGRLRHAVAGRLGADVAARYAARDSWTYGVALLTLATAAGVQLIAPVWVALVVLFAGAQGLAVRAAAREANASRGLPAAPSPTRVLMPLFFLSGTAALIYQVAWQRTLYAHFGVNMESVTIIVSIFMFGLGVGALAGGRLSRLGTTTLPWLFVAIELGIAAFGAASIPLIQRVGAMAELQSLPVIAVTVFGVLAVPTFLMGATLPVLVAYVNRESRDVGASVARLYFVNTLGSAFACFLTVDVLFAFTGLRGSTMIAALCNAAVAMLCITYVARARE